MERSRGIRGIQKLTRVLNQKAFSHVPSTMSEKYYVLKESGYPLGNSDFTGLDPEVAFSFQEIFAKVRVYEYIFRYTRGCTIEPRHGWAITPENQLLDESFPYSGYYATPAPSILRYRLPRQRIHLNSAVSVRYGWFNYWHWFNDILGELVLLDRYGVSRDIPIVIPKALSERAYFIQSLKRSPELRARNWVPQSEKCYVEVDEAYFCHNMQFVLNHFDCILEMLSVPLAQKSSQNRIYLTRNATRARRLANAVTIENVAREYGFEIVDTDPLTLDQQIELFSNTAIIIAIHGAGLTNMMFRRGADLRVLEIFPSDSVPPYYFQLARHFGFSYDGICGTSEISGMFSLDPDKFRAKVKRLVG